MAQKAVKGSLKLAQLIRLRREDLNLTIEEAAARAGVGSKTWSRYEAGGSIRQDKCKGICKALSWRVFPNEDTDVSNAGETEEYKSHEAWSTYLAETFGECAALAFAAGSDILLDYLKEDMQELSSMAKGTHIGQLSVSMLEPYLPQQFLMEYDYNFLYAMRMTVLRLRELAHGGGQIVAHSVLEELAIYLFAEMSQMYLESLELDVDRDNEWVFDVLGDCDLLIWLYSKFYLTNESEYHFEHWGEPQF